MRLQRARRKRAAEDAELAVVRLAALGKRSGWVPRVPESVAPEPAAPQPVAPEPAAPQPVAPEPGSPSPDARERTAPGRHRSGAAAAMADRMPLPLRAVVESLPPGVRRGALSVERGQAVVIVLVILLGLAATALLTGVGRPRVATVEPSAASTVVATGTPVPEAVTVESETAPATGEAAPGTGPAELVVHVAGKVAEPGIVRLPAGARVVDAIDAAGGAADEADLGQLNLARVLVDGEQVAVGIDPPADQGPVSGSGTPGPTGAVVNLNTATTEQLETLPGIGPALAAQIMQWREDHGRFTAIEELEEVSGIGPKKLAGLADQVTV